PETVMPREEEVIVVNKLGVHGKVDVSLIRAKEKHEVKLFITTAEGVFEISGIMSLLKVAMPKGAHIKLAAKGKNADVFIDEILKK
ncbi:HPr family phosphocarrier protein, partial [Patescibacteria group bacterium]|nr:HPr family phosphocarrier protein [Patescibacteria group bacterium]